MIAQYIIVGIVVALAFFYALYRIRKALGQKSGDPCYGCALKKVCKKEKRLSIIKEKRTPRE
jgi:hypothetical protein